MLIVVAVTNKTQILPNAFPIPLPIAVSFSYDIPFSTIIIMNIKILHQKIQTQATTLLFYIHSYLFDAIQDCMFYFSNPSACYQHVGTFCVMELNSTLKLQRINAKICVIIIML